MQQISCIIRIHMTDNLCNLNNIVLNDDISLIFFYFKINEVSMIKDFFLCIDQGQDTLLSIYFIK